MIRLSWIIICDVAPLVAPVQEGLQLLRSPEATVDADLRTAVHEAAERLVHHNFVEGHGRESRRDFDEVDAVLLGPALNNLAVSGARLLHRELARTVVADGVDRHPVV